MKVGRQSIDPSGAHAIQLFMHITYIAIFIQVHSSTMNRSPQAQAALQGMSKPSGVSPSKSTAINNRKCVVVGQKMVKTEVKISAQDFDHSDMRLSDASMQESRSVDGSPTGSVRSSNSSFQSNVYSGLEGSIASRETKLLDELKSDIENNAVQLKRLASEVKEIPTLRKRVDEVEKEKKALAEDLSEKREVVETLKQRLSVLHEQNSQLALLSRSSKGDESSDTTLRMRNALVASLAQIKKLQAMVDEIPELKAEISSLNQKILSLKKQEQDVLKCHSITLPDGTTSSRLLEENKKLKASNEYLSTKLQQVSNNVDILTDSIQDVRMRSETFEKSLSTSIPLNTRIKQLEKEREGLYEELIHLKLDKSLSLDFDSILLSNECEVLRKANSSLQDRLEELTVQYKEQKEKIIMKLFEIEVSSVESQKLEVEKQLFGVSPSTHQADRDSHEDDTSTTLSPEFKAQILKLNQCRLEIEQSHRIMHLVLSEKEDLERKLTAVNTKLDERSVVHLEDKVRDYDKKLGLARAKINDLEKRLRISSQTGDTTLLSENMSLKAQLNSLQEDKNESVKLQKLLLEEQRLQEVNLQKYRKSKEQRQKLEVKVKELSQKCQILATELSASVELMKNYQVQCGNFEKEIEIVSAEKESYKTEATSLKAQLEVFEAEYIHPDISDSAIPLSLDETQKVELEELRKENSELKDKIVKESKEMQGIIDQKTNELMRMEEKCKELDVQLADAQEMLAAQQVENTKAFEESNTSICQLESEVKKMKQEQAAALASKDLLKSRVQELSDKSALLSTKLTEALDSFKQLQSQTNTKDEECRHLQLIAKDSEIKISGLLAEIDRHKSSTSIMKTDILEKDKALSRICKSLEQKEAEIEHLNQAIQDSTLQSNSKIGQLNNEIEGYKAMIQSLQRQLDEAETREIEHELLKQKIRKLEQSLGDSSHDNKALIKLLQETIQELPSLSGAEQSLQDHNLQLEEQVSVLSQWNDKQRSEIEELERNLDESAKAYDALIMEIKGKDDILEENVQLKRELKEVEIEVNALRRQVRADMQEELQLKLEAQTQLLAVFNQHNTLLQRQVGFYVFLEPSLLQ